MSFLITSVLNFASDRLAIFLSLSCIFSGALICSFIWAFFFFLSWHASYIVRGGAQVFARVGQPTSLHGGTVGGEGVLEGTMPLAQFLAGFQSLPPLPRSKLGPYGADSPGE